MDETEAIAELRCLSDNAKRWIEDRVGNGLGAMIGFSSAGMHNRVEQASEKLLTDLHQIGIFEMQTRRSRAAREEA